jgi:hypothetical protein
MFRWLLSPFKKKTPTTHCFIQFTPILVDGFKINDDCEDNHHKVSLPKPEDLPEGVADKVTEFINGEADAFLEWSGAKREEIAMDMFTGFPTIFLLLITQRPDDLSEKVKETIESMVYELSYCAVMGDTGTRLGFKGDLKTQTFDSRCRWTVPLR